MSGVKTTQNGTLTTVEAGSSLVVAGTIDVTGAQKIGGVALSASAAEINAAADGTGVTVTFSIAAAGANVSEVTCTVKDGAGGTVAVVHHLDIYLTDVATGVGLTGTTASGTVTAKAANGVVLSTYTAKKALRVQTLASGVFILEITDTAKSGFFVAVVVPVTGKVAVSAQLVTGSYG